METQTQQKSGLDTPKAILFGAVIIAIGLAIGLRGGNTPVAPLGQAQPEEPAGPTEYDIEIAADEHIVGDRNARFVLVEYSDYECPFCTRVHPTLEALVANNTDVAWSYRHFPLGFHE